MAIPLSTTQWTPIGPATVKTPGVSLGFSAGRIEAAAADTTSPDVVYAVGNNGGVWKTANWNNDSQPTWLPLSDGQASLNFAGYHPLVIHPANTNLILGVVCRAGGGVLKSTNFGLGWQLLGNSEFEGAALGSIAVHPTNPGVLYVSVWDGGAQMPGVYRSTDGGLTWTNLTPEKGPASDVVISPSSSQILYAGLVPLGGQGASTSGVYRSSNGGITWDLLTGLPSGIFVGQAIRLEAFRKGVVYAAMFVRDSGDGSVQIGRFRSNDGGDTWKKLAPTPGKFEKRSWHLLIAAAPKMPDRVFVNDEYELYGSKDGGTTWSLAENIGDDWVNMTFDANGNAVVTADRGIYHYNPATNQWLQRSGNLQVTQLYDVTLDPANADRVFGVAQDHFDAMGFGGSIEWNVLPAGGNEFGKVLIDPGNSGRLYVSDPLQLSKLVQRSTDGGQTWHTILGFAILLPVGQDPPDPYPLASAVQKSFVMDPSNPKRLLVGTTVVNETEDADSGTPTWSFSKVLSPGKTPAEQFITALAIAPSKSETAYAATGDGHVWATFTGGTDWIQRDAGLFGSKASAVVDIRIDADDPRHAVVVAKGPGGYNVWELRPIGQNYDWINITGDLPPALEAVCIFADWRYPIPALYVGTSRAVYHSVNMGVHWEKFGLYLPNTRIEDLQFTAANEILAAATFGRGVWEILLRPSKISGSVYEDLNGDGRHDDNDPGMADVTVFLDSNGNGALDDSELRTRTDARGHYTFAKVPPGTYVLRQIVPSSHVQTTPEHRPMAVSGSDVRRKEFGNARRPDQPTTRGTVLPGRQPGQPIGAPDEFSRGPRKSGPSRPT